MVWTGATMEYNVTVGIFGTFYVNPNNNGLDEKDSASLTPFNTKYPDSYPVMQFIGIKDINGCEVYENFILRVEPTLSTSDLYNKFPHTICKGSQGDGYASLYGSYIGVVRMSIDEGVYLDNCVYQNDAHESILKEYGDVLNRYKKIPIRRFNKAQTIGNIYQTPELLK